MAQSTGLSFLYFGTRAFSASMHDRKSPAHARTSSDSPRKCGIFNFSTENAKIEDWLAERNGFELSVPVSKLADDSFEATFAT
jgi:hypothetical protein